MRQRILERSVRKPFTSQDVAAALLGEDLWFAALRDYYVYLQATKTEPPHMWNLSTVHSHAELDVAWQSLSFPARTLRARLGALTTGFRFLDTPSVVGFELRAFSTAVRDLCKAGLCSRVSEHGYVARAIATPQSLRQDLQLIQIIAHWLQMLRHADSVARDKRPNGYEVAGYKEACLLCRGSWGLRSRDPHWIPPFHPGCRCFAQPRFTK